MRARICICACARVFVWHAVLLAESMCVWRLPFCVYECLRVRARVRARMSACMWLGAYM